MVLWGISEELELALVAILQEHYAQEPLLTNEVDDFGYVHALEAERMVLHKDLIRCGHTDPPRVLARPAACS